MGIRAMAHDTRHAGAARPPLRLVGREAAGIAAAALDPPRRRAAATLDGLAYGVATAGRALRGNEHRLSGVAAGAAAWLHRLAHDVRTRTIGELGGDLAVFARRRPWLFAAGAFVAGVALARLIRDREGSASRHRPLPVRLASRHG